MGNFDLLWFETIKEKEEASIKAKKILESVKMHPNGIKHFLQNEELIWNVCNDTETILNWEKNQYGSSLSSENEYHLLALVLTEIS